VITEANLETVSAILLVALAMLPFALRMWKARTHWIRAGAPALLLIFPATTGWMVAGLLAEIPASPPASDRPAKIADAGYISSDACRSCHPQEYDTWHASYHRTMTQVATVESVAPPWSGAVEIRGETLRLERDGESLWISLDPPPGSGQPPIRRKIVMTTGSHHMQVFWMAVGDDRKVVQLPVMYLIDEARWVPVNASYVVPPQRKWKPAVWNTSCIKCHATHPRARFDRGGVMNTQVGEFGIACEACHGPGETHVQENQNPWRRYKLHLFGDRDGTTTHPLHLPPQRSAEVCGQCHGVLMTVNRPEEMWEWNKSGHRYRPGDELASMRQHFGKGVDHPAVNDFLRKNPGYMSTLFWSDGMIRVTGREYNGLIESPCFQHDDAERTMTCLSCHRMHQGADDPRPIRTWADEQLEQRMETNDACLQCHPAVGDTLVQHTRHQPGSSGSLCYNCHMPHTTYGLMGAIRSHQVDSPSAKASVATGRPNGCNQCHLDKTLSWTSEYLKEWYDMPRPVLSDDQRSIAASVLWTLGGDAGQRVLMAWSLGWKAAHEAAGEEWIAPYLARLLSDPYAAVRLVAYRSLLTLPHYEAFEYDYIAPTEILEGKSRQVLAIWERSAHDRADAPEQVLISPAGGLRDEPFERIFAERDNREVWLQE
jgi:hypothetical protein